MAKKIYQIHLSLGGAKPPIWRRLLISSDTKLEDLHYIIQATMGWYNCHLHQFISGQDYYLPASPDDIYWDEMGSIDYKGMKVSRFLKKEKDTFVYEYDFGDSWEHTIKLEKILPFDKTTYLPVCIKGKMACPPEDCGGIWGYANVIEILNDPKHEEYEEMLIWVGDDFDPKKFFIEDANRSLQTITETYKS